MTNPNRTAARSAVTAIAVRIAAFVASNAGAVVDTEILPTIHDGAIVVCGAPAELAKVQRWAHSLGIECSIDPVLADDPDFANWTCARISLASAERALLAAQRTAAGVDHLRLVARDTTPVRISRVR